MMSNDERFKVKLGRFYDNGQILTEEEVLKLLNEIQRWENIVVEDTEHIEKLQNENELLKRSDNITCLETEILQLKTENKELKEENEDLKMNCKR